MIVSLQIPVSGECSDFIPPWKHKKTKGFLVFSEGIKLGYCSEMIIAQQLFHCTIIIAQKMKFFIKVIFSKRDQIRGELRIWSHLLNESLMKNFIFCAVYILHKCFPLLPSSPPL